MNTPLPDPRNRIGQQLISPNKDPIPLRPRSTRRTGTNWGTNSHQRILAENYSRVTDQRAMGGSTEGLGSARGVSMNS